ncbi:MAG: LuxR C-terminal-related transcriptional regulator [Caldilineaceae bacterium]
MATIGLGGIQEAENQLDRAVASYQRALHLFGAQPLPSASEAHLGLARICYERNDLAAAQEHAQQCIQLAQQLEKSDRIVLGEVLLARLLLAQGDGAGATVRLTKAEQVARQHQWLRCLIEVAAVQVMTLLAQGRISEAMHLAQTHEHPVSQARVHLAQGDAAAALALLAPLRTAPAGQGRADERLRVMVLQALALYAHDEQAQAEQLLGETLALAEPGGYIRTFVDEGAPLARLLAQLLPRAVLHGVTPAYLRQLLALFATEKQTDGDNAVLSNSASDQPPIAQPAFLIEPLSEREVEVLQLIAAGHKNQEIADELVVSLNTVRYHTKNLYGKLGVNKRTQAVAKAQELGLI